MKKIILAAAILKIMIQSVSGQIVLTPSATGYVQENKRVTETWSHYDGGYNWYFFEDRHTELNANQPDLNVKVSSTMYSTYHHQGDYTRIRKFYDIVSERGILEFDLVNTESGAAFPPPDMTAYNWTAKLIDLSCTYQSGESIVNVYDLSDEFEDSTITETEFDGRRSRIAYGIEFEDINITETLRHDLFGEGNGESSSGFLFITRGGMKRYNSASPRIEIIGQWMIPTPEPTATPEQAQPGIALYLSQKTFKPGDNFKLDMVFTKHEASESTDLPFVLLLDVCGEYYWFPGWTHIFEFAKVELDDGIISQTILDFTWPDVPGSVDGIMFYGALLNSEMTEISGDWDSVTFGWSP